jgi:hypothetical protein
MPIGVAAQETGVSYIFVTMAIAGLLVKNALNLGGQRIDILSLDIGELGGIERLG